MRFGVGAALLLATNVSFGCGRFGGAAGGAEAAEAARQISEVNAALGAAYRDGDAEAAAEHFTADATLMPPGARDLHGRQPIRSFLDLFFRRTSVEQYALTTVELDVYGDVAYEFGTYEWSSIFADTDTISEFGRYSAVRIKGDDGHWRIHRLLDNTMPRTMH